MKHVHLFVLAGILFSLSACQPTPYQKLGRTGAGGYSHRRLSEDTYYIRFVANNNTSAETVRRYLYRHAAELTLTYGYSHFIILRGPSPLTTRWNYTPYEDLMTSQDGEPNPDTVYDVDVPDPQHQKMTIQCFHQPPKNPQHPCFDAQAYLELNRKP